MQNDDDPTEGMFDDPPKEAKPARRNQMRAKSAFQNEERRRTSPHHIDAEQALFASCVHDFSGETFVKAQAEGVVSNSFYKPAHQLIWTAMLSLQGDKIAVDEVTLVKKLSDAGDLDNIGGAAYLNEILNRVETEVHAHHYVDIIIELATRRGILRASQQLIEGIQNSAPLEDLDIIIERIGKQMSKMDAVAADDFELVSLTDFKRPAKNSPDRLLGKHRYLCRGAGAVFVGSAGIGKTSASLQMAACWGCGKDFMGIECVGPIRILIIQAEDDDGDIGEVWDSISYGMSLRHEELQLVKKNVKIVKDRVNTGAKFLRRLPTYIAAHKPDLVILNPLLSFIGGNISDQQVASAFLRNGLNAINKEEKFAYMLIHHTNKPEKADGKSDTNWSDYMYKMAGSAELANWPRVIITLEAMKTEGIFCMRLAKRGNRAGIMGKYGDPEIPNGTYFEPTNKLTIKHTRAVRTLEDGGTAPMILWERVDECSAEYKEMLETAKAKTGPKPKIEAEEILTFVPVGADRGIDGGRLYTEVKKTYGIGQTMFYAHLKALRESEALKLNDKKQYYRD